MLLPVSDTSRASVGEEVAPGFLMHYLHKQNVASLPMTWNASAGCIAEAPRTVSLFSIAQVSVSSALPQRSSIRLWSSPSSPFLPQDIFSAQGEAVPAGRHGEISSSSAMNGPCSCGCYVDAVRSRYEFLCTSLPPCGSADSSITQTDYSFPSY